MINRLLAKLSDTPENHPGTRAFDVPYQTKNGEERTVILTQGGQNIGEQIRQTLFANHPDATDYTFKEFDYPEFQFRVFVDNSISSFVGHVASGDSFIDETEL